MISHHRQLTIVAAINGNWSTVAYTSYIPYDGGAFIKVYQTYIQDGQYTYVVKMDRVEKMNVINTNAIQYYGGEVMIGDSYDFPPAPVVVWDMQYKLPLIIKIIRDEISTEKLRKGHFCVCINF
jgi:hypothetical protein